MIFQSALIFGVPQPRRLSISARILSQLLPIDEQSPAAETIQHLSIVTHQQSNPLELNQRFYQQLTRGQVYMVGRFVESQYIGFLPQGCCDLNSLAFAMTESVPSRMPIELKAQLPAKPACVCVGGLQQSAKLARALIRALAAIDHILLHNRRRAGPKWDSNSKDEEMLIGQFLAHPKQTDTPSAVISCGDNDPGTESPNEISRFISQTRTVAFLQALSKLVSARVLKC